MGPSANELGKSLSALAASTANPISELFAAACASCLICLLCSCSPQVTDRPRTVTISVCPNTITVAHVLTSDLGLRFDAPEKVFTIREAQRDMPPEIAYVVTLNGRADAKLVVSPDSGDFRDLEVAYPPFSKNVEERTVQDTKGRNFGTDRWGHLQNGERWRYVKFTTGDRVGYGPLSPREADLLDQVVSSACLLPAPQTAQETALGRLSKVGEFAFGPTGNAAVISTGEKDYRTVLARSTALADFEKLFADGNIQAKCYALVGIHRLNPNRLKQLTQPLTQSSETVTIMQGCIVSHAPLNQILKQISAGKY
jgi:hypothetical protein